MTREVSDNRCRFIESFLLAIGGSGALGEVCECAGVLRWIRPTNSELSICIVRAAPSFGLKIDSQSLGRLWLSQV